MRPSAGGAKGFVPVPLRTSEPPQAKQDTDSVQKMLERLQGNTEQNKQAKKEAEDAPAPVRMQMNQMRRGNQASLSQMLEAGGVSAAFREDTRTRADVEFEAILGRMGSVQATEDIDNLSREVLIRFPSFSPEQLKDCSRR
jgi:hypothetical protein